MRSEIYSGIVEHVNCDEIEVRVCNTMGATHGVGTATLPGHPRSPPVFLWGLIRVPRTWVFCECLYIVICPFILFLLNIVLSVLFRFTAFDYLQTFLMFRIGDHFIGKQHMTVTTILLSLYIVLWHTWACVHTTSTWNHWIFKYWNTNWGKYTLKTFGSSINCTFLAPEVWRF
jgi:hypothetical protein